MQRNWVTTESIPVTLGFLRNPDEWISKATEHFDVESGTFAREVELVLNLPARPDFDGIVPEKLASTEAPFNTTYIVIARPRLGVLTSLDLGDPDVGIRVHKLSHDQHCELSSHCIAYRVITLLEGIQETRGGMDKNEMRVLVKELWSLVEIPDLTPKKAKARLGEVFDDDGYIRLLADRPRGHVTELWLYRMCKELCERYWVALRIDSDSSLANRHVHIRYRYHHKHFAVQWRMPRVKGLFGYYPESLVLDIPLARQAASYELTTSSFASNYLYSQRILTESPGSVGPLGGVFRSMGRDKRAKLEAEGQIVLVPLKPRQDKQVSYGKAGGPRAHIHISKGRSLPKLFAHVRFAERPPGTTGITLLFLVATLFLVGMTAASRRWYEPVVATMESGTPGNSADMLQASLGFIAILAIVSQTLVERTSAARVPLVSRAGMLVAAVASFGFAVWARLVPEGHYSELVESPKVPMLFKCFIIAGGYAAVLVLLFATVIVAVRYARLTTSYRKRVGGLNGK